LTAQCLNTIGLVLGTVGVLIIFFWGPPQSDLDEGVGLGLTDKSLLLDGRTVADSRKDQRRLKRFHKIISRVGLGFIGLGFFVQLVAEWSSLAHLWSRPASRGSARLQDAPHAHEADLVSIPRAAAMALRDSPWACQGITKRPFETFLGRPMVDSGAIDATCCRGSAPKLETSRSGAFSRVSVAGGCRFSSRIQRRQLLHVRNFDDLRPGSSSPAEARPRGAPPCEDESYT
jgi:hypothetical protein